MTLSQWLYNAVVVREVLTLNCDYFRLNGGWERRLYEICGQQERWIVNLELLRKKARSTAPLWKFRQMLPRIIRRSEIPDYRVSYESEIRPGDICPLLVFRVRPWK